MEIWLFFNPFGITQQQWEPVWNECHDVLQCFPVSLAALFYEEKWASERKVWKTQLIQGEGNDTVLCFENDMASLVFGGRFKLYRSISKYETSAEHRDILWVGEDDIEGFDRGYRIWENGTGGAPYSLAVLALGILLENRFPANCYMYGFQYSDALINNMRTWLSGAVKTNMALPVCNDPAHLWERLTSLYPRIDMAIQRFCKLVKVPTKESFEFLIAQGCQKALQDELIRQMSDFSSVAQWGVTDLLYPYLEAIKDVEQVAILVKRVHEKNNQDEFSLEILLKILLAEGITVNPLQSEITKEWNDTGDRLVTTMAGFNRLFMRMGGLPNRINYYISPDTLIEIFGCMEPANGVKFQEMIEHGTKKCLDKYKIMEDAADKITEQAANLENLERTDKTEIMARWTRRRYLPFEDFILGEVEEQVKSFTNPSKNLLIIAENLAECYAQIVKSYEGEKEIPLKTDSREKTLEKLLRLADQSGIALRETTWEMIDNETDMDILTMFVVFACLPLEEQTFWNWRKYIFETPTLWTELRDLFLKNL